ncbi:MAG: ATP-binding protein [Gammaproteobacteria bacterium]|nr:ATP-binding protein [Gammaproteobacteria bacterium]
MKYAKLEKTKLQQRLSEPVRFINILAGPRQVGKTTIVRDLIADGSPRGYYVSVDEEADVPISSFNNTSRAVSPPQKKDADWLRHYWHEARIRAVKWADISQRDNSTTQKPPYVFAIDEIQKIEQWSDIVKGLWDEDRANDHNMHVVLLGSAPLLMQKGLSESLAGRYELMTVTHWDFAEMQQAFDFSLEEFIYFGGYPGSATLILEEARWRSYVRESLIQPNIEKDIIQMVRIKNPTLLKQLFELGCHYSGQELSLTKMVAELKEAKHTVTLADYLQLLTQAKLLAGLHKYAAKEVRIRNSVPKLIIFNTALMSAIQDYTFAEAQADRSHWGRLVESAVGAHLLNSCDSDTHVHYWRDGSDEVDFVLTKGRKLTAIEVKSSANPRRVQGLGIFARRNPNAKTILVGAGGIPLAEFLSHSADHWLH